MSDTGILNRLLQCFLEDRLAGGLRSLEDYQALFPGDEMLVAEHYEVFATAGAQPDSASGPRPTSSADSGDQIGPYHLLRELGRGGQATVYLAEDSRLPRKVALKVLHGGHVTHAALARFQREASITSKLEHPGICTVFEAESDGGTPYIAMQYVEGESLSRNISLLAESASPATELGSILESPSAEPTPSTAKQASSMATGGRSRVLRMMALVEKASRALHAAHEAGVLHRDIKPGNIMVTPSGEPVLMDFGLAREQDSDLPTITLTGELFGTPAYMSPEQLTRQAIRLDPRSDVWSMGVTLYECLTLHRPFSAPTREALYQAILTQEPDDPRRFNPAIAKDLKVILETAISKDRNRRYQTARDFAEDLRALRCGEPIAARPIGPVGRTLRWARRQPWRATAAALACLLLAGTGYLAARLPDIVEGQHAVRAARLDETLREAYLELGEGSLERALLAFDRALDDEIDSPEAVGGKTLALLRAGNATQALRFIDDQAAMLERHPALLWMRAEALRATGRDDMALDLERTLGSPREPLAQFLVAVRDIQKGHFNDEAAYRRAYELLERAVVGSSFALPHFELAHVIGHLELEAEARRLAEGLTRRWPKSAEAWHWAGFAERETAPDRAEAAFRMALELEPRSPVYLRRLADALAAQARHAEALALYEECLEIDPGDVLAHANQGNSLRDLRKLQQAIQSYEKALAIDPAHDMAWMGLGNAYQIQGNRKRAEWAYRKAVEADERSHKAWGCLGSLLGDDRRRLPEALDALDRALSLEPGNLIAHSNRGFILLQQGKPEEAEKVFRRCIVLVGEHQGPGLDQEALESGTIHVKGQPTKAGLYNSLGNALLDLRKPEEARRAFEACLEIDSGFTPAHTGLGAALRDLGEYQASLDAYDEGLRRNPDNPLALNGRANTYFALEQWDNCLADYDAAIAVDPEQHLPHANRGLLLMKLNQPEEAVVSLRRAAVLRPEDAQSHNLLKTALKSAGDHESILEEMDRWTKVRPTDAAAWRDLCIQLLRHARRWPDERDSERAIAAAREAAELTRQQDPRILHALALALGYGDQPAEAVAIAAKALRLIAIQEEPDAELAADLERALQGFRKAAGSR